MQNSVLSSSPQYPNAQPYFGVVENTLQALRLVYAARLGVIPRVLRRLNNSERRRMIVSGVAFVFSVEESGIKRWTDGLLFSPSRIDGNFLVYKELNERTISPRQSDRSDWIYMSGEGGRDVYPSAQEHRGQYRTKIAFAAESDASTGGLKIGGLVKKTITVKIHGSDYHLVSYYTQQDLDSERFIPMSSRPDIMSLDLPPQIFTFSDFRTPPRVETARDGRLRIVCEPETQDSGFGGEDIRGYRTTRPPGRQMHVERDTAQSSSTLDSTLIAPSAARNQGVASSSDRGFIHNRQEQSAETIPRYPFEQAGYPSQSASSEGHGGNSQDDWRSSSVDYGLLPQDQREVHWASPQPPYPSHYTSSSLTPNTYFSTSQLRGGERDQSNEQTFDARQVEQPYGYNRANAWPSAVNQHRPSSEGPALSSTFPSPHQWSADSPWASNENTVAQPRPPEINNWAAQSRPMGQRFNLRPQIYTVDAASNERQYEDDDKR